MPFTAEYAKPFDEAVVVLRGEYRPNLELLRQSLIEHYGSVLPSEPRDVMAKGKATPAFASSDAEYVVQDTHITYAGAKSDRLRAGPGEVVTLNDDDAAIFLKAGAVITKSKHDRRQADAEEELEVLEKKSLDGTANMVEYGQSE